MYPNFIVIGAAKCGTSSICDLIGSHTDVFMSSPKEPHFFSRLTDSSLTLEWYQSLFDAGVGKTAIGEGSTSYTNLNRLRWTARRIADTIPNCRLIYMVRHPLRRLESDWMMRRHEGWAPASINKAVQEQATLITAGMYWQNLSAYRGLFPDTQIMVVFLEDFARKPDHELGRCLRHIGVDHSVTIAGAQIPRNAAASFRKDRLFASLIRSRTRLDDVRYQMPGWVRTVAKRLLTRTEKLTVEWDPLLRSSVIDELRDDARQFLEYCNKPPDFWNLDA